MTQSYHFKRYLRLPRFATLKTMASPALITPTSNPKPLPSVKPKYMPRTTTSTGKCSATLATTATQRSRRREFISIAASIIAPSLIFSSAQALAASDEEYIKETSEVISKVRTTINMDKNDPNVADAVADLRETSNSWVAKYRREKALLGRVSFRDIYSALNAVSGHYISFGPTAPIPAKRKVRILEEMESAEKALARGR